MSRLTDTEKILCRNILPSLTRWREIRHIDGQRQPPSGSVFAFPRHHRTGKEVRLDQILHHIQSHGDLRVLGLAGNYTTNWQRLTTPERDFDPKL
jgi:hypothetical protein